MSKIVLALFATILVASCIELGSAYSKHSLTRFRKRLADNINLRLFKNTRATQLHDDSAFTGYRLPHEVIPRHYDLHLRPNLRNFTFDGKVKISFETTWADLRRITLNVLDLAISSGSVDDSNQLLRVVYGSETETATLEFSKPLPLLLTSIGDTASNKGVQTLPAPIDLAGLQCQ